MIKSQRFVPFLLKSFRRPYLPLIFVNTFPSSYTIKGLNLHPIASFVTQSDSNTVKSQEEEEFTSDEEGGEGWGVRVDVYHLRGKSKFNTMFGRVLNRISRTCLIYAKSTAEKKANLTEDSRFYYVKRKFDELGEAQSEEFVKYLNGISDHLMEYSNKKAKIFGIDIEKESEQLRHFRVREKFKKRFIAAYLQSDPKCGKILGDLALEFLEKENADYKSYTRLRDEEVAIGRFRPHGRDVGDRLRAIVDYKDDFLRRFEELLDASKQIASYKIYNNRMGTREKRIQDEKSKNSYFSVSNLVRIGFIRVTLTIRLYLTLPRHIVETIPKGSRFYYVHKRLDSWTSEEKHKLWVFLNKIKRDVNFGLPEEIAKGKKVKTFASANQDEVFYLLRHKDYGKLLQECCDEFFEEENMDRFYFLNSYEDEFIAGKFAAPSKRMKKFTKEYYNTHFSEIRQKFKDYLNAETPEDLVKPRKPKEQKEKKQQKEQKEQKERSEDGNEEKVKRKRGRKPKNTFGNISI